MAKRENAPVIFPASTKAQDFFENQGDPTKGFKNFDKMLFGVEIECNVGRKLHEKFIDTGEDTRQNVVDTIYPVVEDVAIFKFEALPYGFELASAPATFEWHRTAWNDLFARIESNPFILEKHGKGCGMHVHLSKAGFKDQFHIGRMGFFIHREENREFIENLGGRKHYFAKFGVPSKFDQQKNLSRNAFHMQTSHETVEARFFQSTLIRSEFLKNLEFLHCLIRFTRPSVGKEHKEKLTVDEFKAFLAEGTRKNRYPYLWNFLNPENPIPEDSVDTDAPEVDNTPTLVKRTGPIGEFIDAPSELPVEAK